ncbi:MAG TPA: radical SAM protein [Propionibacteriaceae bacterium]
MTPLHFVLKTASRCNLNCSYCYVYNKGNDSWRGRPALMPDRVFDASVERIRRYCEHSSQPTVSVSFHGGEPCMIGSERFAQRCARLRREFGDSDTLRLVLQTNGTLLDSEWAEVLRTYKVEVGVSVDGTQEVHDAHRVDHGGRGSYLRVRQGLAALAEAKVPFSILSVIQLGTDGLAVHRHLLGLEPAGINYLFPDYTHDTFAAVRRGYGATPCWDVLRPIFDDWAASWPPAVEVPLFWNVIRLVMGADSTLDVLGNDRLPFAFVHADGAIEALDVLGVCGADVAATGLNVLTDDFAAIARVSNFHRTTIFEGTALPEGCRSCPERDSCGGGYLPHRHSRERGFDNPSVWCADLLAFFSYVRRWLDVSPDETAARRRALRWLAEEAVTA